MTEEPTKATEQNEVANNMKVQSDNYRKQAMEWHEKAKDAETPTTAKYYRKKAKKALKEAKKYQDQYEDQILKVAKLKKEE